MKKSSVSSQNLGTFPSPGAPDYRDKSASGQKGWCSERVPLPASGSRRYISAAAMTPFYSGRTLPSKWEDAERWICSPVSGYHGVGRNSILQQPQRRPKSKSGPLGPPGAAYYSNYSPAVADSGGGVRNLVVGSPFSTGVLRADELAVYYSGPGGGGEMEKNVARSSSVPGWSDLLSESYSLPSSQDDKLDGNKDAESTTSPNVSRRDMATQMSPEGSAYSSPKREYSLCTSPCRPIEEKEQNDHPAKLEVRDVQVDKRATIISWSRRHGARTSKKHLPDVEDFNTSTAAETRATSWDIVEAAKDVSKLQRDEAKIAAWENLQKAKAEAAIRKLEMKLEKKRSASMDKILNDLKMAQIKAQKMRSSMSATVTQPDHQDKKTPHKILCFRKHVQSTYLTGCFTCHAF